MHNHPPFQHLRLGISWGRNCTFNKIRNEKHLQDTLQRGMLQVTLISELLPDSRSASETQQLTAIMLTARRQKSNTVVIKGQVSASGQELHQTGICFYALLKTSESKGTFSHHLRAHTVTHTHTNTHLHTSHILTMQTGVCGVWVLSEWPGASPCVCCWTGVEPRAVCGRWWAGSIRSCWDVKHRCCPRPAWWRIIFLPVYWGSLSEARLRNEKYVCFWRCRVIRV